MSYAWHEKINRLEELEYYFKEYLKDEVIKNIQYISIRKIFNTRVLLVGVNDIEYENIILDFAPRIVLLVKEHQEKKDDEWENTRIPTKMRVFKYSLEEKAKKKALLLKWKTEPLSCFEKTELENMVADDLSYFIKDKKIFPIDNTWCSDRYRLLGLNNFLFNKEPDYDFIAIDRYKKEWHYVEFEGAYLKFIPPIKINITASDKVGYCKVCIDSPIKEVSRQTYINWRKQYETMGRDVQE